MNKEERLREYINKDYSYINYKTGVEDGTDFDKFCIQHCKDIEELLEENEKLKADLQLYRGALKRENEAIHRANDLEEVIDKAIEYIKEKYDYILGDDTFLDHDEIIDRKQIIHILELLGDKEVSE